MNLDDYLSSLPAQIDGSVSYLNQIIAWQLTFFAAIIGAVVALWNAGFPTKLGIILTFAFSVITSHHASRAGKAYINVIRFSMLRRELLKFKMTAGDDSEAIRHIRGMITSYDIEWHSPISRKSVLTKLLVELGFGYQYLLIAGMSVWYLWAEPSRQNVFLVMAIVLCSALIIIFELFRSPYLKKVSSDEIAERLK